METKVCKCCGKELPLTDFYKNSATKDKHDNSCKKCRNQKIAEAQKRRVPQPGIKSMFRISDFEDNQLFAELRRRGYSGELHYSKVIAV